MLQLRFVGIEKPPVWLVDESYLIGSAAGCRIHLQDSSVLSQHAELRVSDERVSINPLSADAALWVNGLRVHAPTTLEHGSEVQVGSHRLRITDPKRDKPTAAAGKEEVWSVWALQSKTTALAKKAFPIAGDMIVGRARECDLCLAVAHLSRRHARLFFDAGGLWVEDLGSANGTFVNGQRIDRSRLRAGDELAFDTLAFLVKGEEGEDEEAQADKTSLRPALAAFIPAAKAQSNESRQSHPSARAPSKVDKRRPTSSADTPDSREHNSLLLWAAITAILLLTALLVLYFSG